MTTLARLAAADPAVGDEDVVTPPASSRDLAARIPGAELVSIPGAGHLANLDQPERFNQALSAFLDRHADRASAVGR